MSQEARSAAHVPLRLCFAFDDPGVVHLCVRKADSDDEATLCGRRAMPGELSRRATTCEDCFMAQPAALARETT